MKMGSKKAIDRIKPEGEIYNCPACDYTDGFHVAFKMNDTTKTGEIMLICPRCSRRFRLGWHVQFQQ